MPLVVHALHIAILFLNIYDTFKTLKPPQSRSNARAMGRRKREMKGCLSVWIVWCCLTAYERLLGSIFALIVPFHDEVKSFVMFFLIVTRARGAEVIFLHAIRPLIKPYTESVDLTLEIVCMFGDVLFTLSSIPFKFAMSWWQRRPWKSGHTISEFEELVSSTTNQRVLEELAVPRQHRLGAGTLNHTRSTTEIASHRRRRGTRHTAESDPLASRMSIDDLAGHAKSRSESSTNGRARVSRSNSSRSIRSHTTRSVENIVPVVPVSSHEIWHPPPAARAEDENSATWEGNHIRDDGSHDAQLDSTTDDTVIQQQELVVEEWRLYPPFPSAYPPTPLPPTSKLPDIPTAITSRKPFPTILEDQEDPAPSDATTNHSESSFAPGPVEEAGNDGDAEDENEDDFSLRTPPPTRLTAADGRRNLIRAKSKLKSRADLSRTIPFLDVAVDDSTRTGSQSATESSISDSDSFAPQTIRAKKTDPIRNGDVTGLSKPKASTWSLASGGRPGTSRLSEEPAKEMDEKSSGKVRLEQARVLGSQADELAKSVRSKSKTTRGTGQEAPSLRVSTRLVNARRVGERTSSQSSTASTVPPGYSRLTLPRNARTRK